MKKGVVFAFDAMVAASVVLALLLVWAGAHAITLESAAASAREETSAARIAAAADWLVKQNGHDFSEWGGAGAEEQVAEARGIFRLDELRAWLEVYGGEGRNAGRMAEGGESWCVSRAGISGRHAAILRVCGRQV